MMKCVVSCVRVDQAGRAAQSRLGTVAVVDGRIKVLDGDEEALEQLLADAPVNDPGTGRALTPADGDAWLRALPWTFSGAAVRCSVEG